jgi:hypothetical protein
MVTRFQRASWLVGALVTLVMFGLIVPLLPALGPDSRHLDVDTTVGLATASVTIPAGWDLDIAAASQSRPVAALGDVEVSVVDAVWLGTSQRLVDNASSLVFSTSPAVPEIPDDADGADREEWLVVAAADAEDDDPRQMTVIRNAESVVLVIVRGPAADVEAAIDAIDAIVASVELAGPAVDVEARS